MAKHITARAALEKYLVGVINDRRTSMLRRDRAAATLGRLLGNKKQAKAGRRPDVRPAKEPRPAREHNTTYVSKKLERKDNARALAASDEWSDLIPKASVTPIRKAER